jgi:hypothetical protein
MGLDPRGQLITDPAESESYLHILVAVEIMNVSSE